MKNIFLGVLREVGIALVILVVLAAVTVFAFSSQLPFEDKVPEGEKYVEANLKDYSVSSTDRISEVNKITVTHEANQGQIISAENDVRIQTGKYTPFGSIDSITDLPSEKVGVSVSISNSDSKTTDNSGADENENLEYPDVLDKQIQDIEKSESESSESAANRRMGNVD